jgi:hypothetical protein
MPGNVLLTCGECGCASDEHAKGWAAFADEDPDGLEPTSVVIMCPVCAARKFSGGPKRQRATRERGFPSSRELRGNGLLREHGGRGARRVGRNAARECNEAVLQGERRDSRSASQVRPGEGRA